MTFEVSTGAAYAVLYCILGFFAILAILSAGYGAMCLPDVVKNLIVADKKAGDDDAPVERMAVTAGGAGLLSTDFFL